MNYDHNHPILGVYYYPHPDWEPGQVERDLEVFAENALASVWLFFDIFYDTDNRAGLGALLGHAEKVGLTVVPVLGQFLQLKDHPDVRIVNADGTTSDNPRYWNMGCFRNPKLLQIATERATDFLRDHGDHPALYRIEGLPLMSFVHEAYYRNSIPEFGGGPMMPSCYCEHCLTTWRDYLAAHNVAVITPAPREADDPVLWQHWLNYHAEAIPAFLHKLIQATKAVHPVWSTHECNDFYPASWQSVYTGNDWWRVGAVLDFGHEDMYPLEFDTRYVCYVYDYAKDIMRSAMQFDGLTTANGQAFDSWLGYQLPENSMSEQVYSALAHGALGLVWWTQLPDRRDALRGETLEDIRYRMIRKTAQPNAEYAALVATLQDYEPERAKVALLYSWTTMGAERNDHHTYDTLFLYQMLVQIGYAVDVLSEQQIAAGLLTERGYRVAFAPGCSALPEAVHAALDRFALGGGLLVADHAPHLTHAYPPALAQWRRENLRPRIYTLPDGTPVPVQLAGAGLNPPPAAQVIARFDDDAPAICRIMHGAGAVVLAGSYLGWDYTNYPGYYDLGEMFPFHVRQDAALRQFVANILADVDVVPPVHASHPDVEVGLWHTAPRDAFVVFAINHLQSSEQTTISLLVEGEGWQVFDALTDAPIACSLHEGAVRWDVCLERLQGHAYCVKRS